MDKDIISESTVYPNCRRNTFSYFYNPISCDAGKRVQPNAPPKRRLHVCMYNRGTFCLSVSLWQRVVDFFEGRLMICRTTTWVMYNLFYTIYFLFALSRNHGPWRNEFWESGSFTRERERESRLNVDICQRQPMSNLPYLCTCNN